MNVPSQPRRPDTRIPELDGVRGLAILMVVFWHYVVCLVPAGSIMSRIGASSWSGVDLFFVLSGFLIGGIHYDHARSPHFLRTFYARRVFRIFPLYFAWLAAYFILVPRSATGDPWNFSGAMPGWTYTAYLQNFSMAARNDFGAHWLAMTWSLAVEEQFYLLLPFLFFSVPARLLPWLIPGFAGSAFLLRVVLSRAYPGHGLAQFVLLPCRWDALFIGVGVACLTRLPRFIQGTLASLRFLPGAVLALLAAAIVMTWARFPANGWKGSFQFSEFALLYGAIILIVVSFPDLRICTWLRVPPLRALGTHAYGIYMFHEGILGLVHHASGNAEPKLATVGDILLTFASLGLTLLLAAASFRFFEEPLVRIGRRFNYASVDPRPTASKM